MKDLLYKDLKLGVAPIFYILPILTGALMLIPGWIYFMVIMYFCFITVPNMLANFKVQNDLQMSILMPVKKEDIIKARLLTIMFLEMLHIVGAAIFAIINLRIYSDFYYIFMRPHLAYFGFVFILFGIFNLILIPMYYRSGYKYGWATAIGTGIIVLLSTGLELLNIFNPTFRQYMTLGNSGLHVIILVVGIIVFIITGFMAYFRAKTNFERVDV